MTEAEKPFAEWVGRTIESEDLITDRLVMSFRAIFGPWLAPVAADEAPLGIHWCLSPEIEPMTALGNDGHPAKNHYLPPVPLPRRMWAGGSIESVGKLRVGDCVRRKSVIADVSRKVGRTGELWFVTINRDYVTSRGIAIRERQDVVYRAAAAAAAGREPPSGGDKPARQERATRAVWTIETTPTLLFRYSAITFNGHRIHYDLPYARDVEGYAGLVVHGPVQATLLLNMAAGDAATRRFDYRAVSPAIAGSLLQVCAGTDEEQDRLWTQSPEGQVHMEATAAD